MTREDRIPELGAPLEEEQYEAQIDRIARGAGISSFGQGIGRIIGYATQVTVAHVYGATQLGFYVLGMTLVEIAGLLSRFGMDNGVVRYVAQYRAEGEASRIKGVILLALWASFGLSLIFSALMFFGAGFLAGVFDKPFMEPVARTFSFSLPFFTVMSIALWSTSGFQTVKYLALVQEIMRPLIGLGLILVFYFLGAKILGAVAAYALSMAGGAALALLYLRRMFPRLLDRVTVAKFEPAALFNVSGPMIVANFTNRLSPWAAVMVLGVFLPASSVGIFNAAMRTAGLCTLVLMAFVRIFSPMVSNLYSRGRMGELDGLFKDVSRWTFTGSLAIFLVIVVLARDILAVFGPRFVTGWVVLWIMAAAQLFGSSVGPTARVLAMTGHQRTVMVATMGSAVTSVAISLALVPVYGVLGAGLATAGAIVLANVITLLAVNWRVGLWPYDRSYLRPLAAGVLATGVTLLCRLVLPLPGPIFTVLVLGSVFMAGFTLLLLAFGLTPGDRRFLNAFWAMAHRNVWWSNRTRT